MYIKELRLRNFGKFHNKEITLNDGVNLIYGENEAGKSTIHAFIKGMFFGITRQRGRSTKDDSYSRFLPWDNRTQFDGSMDIVVDEKNYRIYRNFHKDDREYRIIDVKTGKDLDINQVEQKIYGGLTESNYKNTISIEQTKARTEKELALEIQNYVANLSTSKNNEVNVSRAVASLQNKKKNIEAKDTKDRLLIFEQRKAEYIENKEKINILTNQLKERKERHKKNNLLLEKKYELQKKLEHINLKISEYSNKLPELMKNDLLELQEIKQKEVKLKQELQKINQINDQRNNQINDQRNNQINDQISKQRNNQINADNNNMNTKDNTFWISFIFTIIFIGIVLLTENYHHCSVWLILCILLLSTAFYLINYKNAKKTRNREIELGIYNGKEEGEKNKKVLPTEKTVTDVETKTVQIVDLESQITDVESRIIEIKSYLYEMDKKTHRILALYEVKDDMELKEKYEDTLKSRLSVDDLMDKKKDIIESLRQLNEKQIETNYEEGLIQIEKLKWELNGLEESQEKCIPLEKEYQELLDKKRQEDDEIKAINLAVDTINELSVQIHDDFGYQLNNLVSDIISKVTEDKYSDIKIDEKLNIKLGYKNDFVDLDKLSIGTIEQVYLALRVAVAEVILNDIRMPLILDECFAYYDENRLRNIITELIHNHEKQIIIFTCHKRERKILDELGVNYNYISFS